MQAVATVPKWLRRLLRVFLVSVLAAVFLASPRPIIACIVSVPLGLLALPYLAARLTSWLAPTFAADCTSLSGIKNVKLRLPLGNGGLESATTSLTVDQIQWELKRIGPEGSRWGISIVLDGLTIRQLARASHRFGRGVRRLLNIVMQLLLHYVEIEARVISYVDVDDSHVNIDRLSVAGESHRIAVRITRIEHHTLAHRVTIPTLELTADLSQGRFASQSSLSAQSSGLALLGHPHRPLLLLWHLVTGAIRGVFKRVVFAETLAANLRISEGIVGHVSLDALLATSTPGPHRTLDEIVEMLSEGALRKVALTIEPVKVELSLAPSESSGQDVATLEVNSRHQQVEMSSALPMGHMVGDHRHIDNDVACKWSGSVSLALRQPAYGEADVRSVEWALASQFVLSRCHSRRGHDPRAAAPACARKRLDVRISGQADVDGPRLCLRDLGSFVRAAHLHHFGGRPSVIDATLTLSLTPSVRIRRIGLCVSNASTGFLVTGESATIISTDRTGVKLLLSPSSEGVRMTNAGLRVDFGDLEVSQIASAPPAPPWISDTICVPSLPSDAIDDVMLLLLPQGVRWRCRIVQLASTQFLIRHDSLWENPILAMWLHDPRVRICAEMIAALSAFYSACYELVVRNVDGSQKVSIAFPQLDCQIVKVLVEYLTDPFPHSITLPPPPVATPCGIHHTRTMPTPLSAEANVSFGHNRCSLLLSLETLAMRVAAPSTMNPSPPVHAELTNVSLVAKRASKVRDGGTVPLTEIFYLDRCRVLAPTSLASIQVTGGCFVVTCSGVTALIIAQCINDLRWRSDLWRATKGNSPSLQSEGADAPVPRHIQMTWRTTQLILQASSRSHVRVVSTRVHISSTLLPNASRHWTDATLTCTCRTLDMSLAGFPRPVIAVVSASVAISRIWASETGSRLDQSIVRCELGAEHAFIHMSRHLVLGDVLYDCKEFGKYARKAAIQLFQYYSTRLVRQLDGVCAAQPGLTALREQQVIVVSLVLHTVLIEWEELDGARYAAVDYMRVLQKTHDADVAGSLPEIPLRTRKRPALRPLELPPLALISIQGFRGLFIHDAAQHSMHNSLDYICRLDSCPNTSLDVTNSRCPCVNAVASGFRDVAGFAVDLHCDNLIVGLREGSVIRNKGVPAAEFITRPFLSLSALSCQGDVIIADMLPRRQDVAPFTHRFTHFHGQGEPHYAVPVRFFDEPYSTTMSASLFPPFGEDDILVVCHRGSTPTKLYHNLRIELCKLELETGPLRDGDLHAFAVCLERMIPSSLPHPYCEQPGALDVVLQPAPLGRSAPLKWWDKLRFYLHGHCRARLRWPVVWLLAPVPQAKLGRSTDPRPDCIPDYSASIGLRCSSDEVELAFRKGTISLLATGFQLHQVSSSARFDNSDSQPGTGGRPFPLLSSPVLGVQAALAWAVCGSCSPYDHYLRLSGVPAEARHAAEDRIDEYMTFRSCGLHPTVIIRLGTQIQPIRQLLELHRPADVIHCARLQEDIVPALQYLEKFHDVAKCLSAQCDLDQLPAQDVLERRSGTSYMSFSSTVYPCSAEENATHAFTDATVANTGTASSFSNVDSRELPDHVLPAVPTVAIEWNTAPSLIVAVAALTDVIPTSPVNVSLDVTSVIGSCFPATLGSAIGYLLIDLVCGDCYRVDHRARDLDDANAMNHLPLVAESGFSIAWWANSSSSRGILFRGNRLSFTGMSCHRRDLAVPSEFIHIPLGIEITAFGVGIALASVLSAPLMRRNIIDLHSLGKPCVSRTGRSDSFILVPYSAFRHQDGGISNRQSVTDPSTASSRTAACCAEDEPTYPRMAYVSMFLPHPFQILRLHGDVLEADVIYYAAGEVVLQNALLASSTSTSLPLFTRHERCILTKNVMDTSVGLTAVRASEDLLVGLDTLNPSIMSTRSQGANRLRASISGEGNTGSSARDSRGPGKASAGGYPVSAGSQDDASRAPTKILPSEQAPTAVPENGSQQLPVTSGCPYVLLWGLRAKWTVTLRQEIYSFIDGISEVWHLFWVYSWHPFTLDEKAPRPLPQLRAAVTWQQTLYSALVYKASEEDRLTKYLFSQLYVDLINHAGDFAPRLACRFRDLPASAGRPLLPHVADSQPMRAAVSMPPFLIARLYNTQCTIKEANGCNSLIVFSRHTSCTVGRMLPADAATTQPHGNVLHRRFRVEVGDMRWFIDPQTTASSEQVSWWRKPLCLAELYQTKATGLPTNVFMEDRQSSTSACHLQMIGSEGNISWLYSLYRVWGENTSEHQHSVTTVATPALSLSLSRHQFHIVLQVIRKVLLAPHGTDKVSFRNKLPQGACYPLPWYMAVLLEVPLTGGDDDSSGCVTVDPVSTSMPIRGSDLVSKAGDLSAKQLADIQTNIAAPDLGRHVGTSFYPAASADTPQMPARYLPRRITERQLRKLILSRVRESCPLEPSRQNAQLVDPDGGTSIDTRVSLIATDDTSTSASGASIVAHPVTDAYLTSQQQDKLCAPMAFLQKMSPSEYPSEPADPILEAGNSDIFYAPQAPTSVLAQPAALYLQFPGVPWKDVRRGEREYEHRCRIRTAEYAIGDGLLNLMDDCGHRPVVRGAIVALHGRHTFYADASTKVDIELGNVRLVQVDSITPGGSEADRLPVLTPTLDACGRILLMADLKDREMTPADRIFRLSARTYPPMCPFANNPDNAMYTQELDGLCVNIYERLELSVFPGAQHTIAIDLTHEIVNFLSRYFSPTNDGAGLARFAAGYRTSTRRRRMRRKSGGIRHTNEGDCTAVSSGGTQLCAANNEAQQRDSCNKMASPDYMDPTLSSEDRSVKVSLFSTFNTIDAASNAEHVTVEQAEHLPNSGTYSNSDAHIPSVTSTPKQPGVSAALVTVPARTTEYVYFNYVHIRQITINLSLVGLVGVRTKNLPLSIKPFSVHTALMTWDQLARRVRRHIVARFWSVMPSMLRRAAAARIGSGVQNIAALASIQRSAAKPVTRSFDAPSVIDGVEDGATVNVNRATGESASLSHVRARQLPMFTSSFFNWSPSLRPFVVSCTYDITTTSVGKWDDFAHNFKDGEPSASLPQSDSDRASPMLSASSVSDRSGSVIDIIPQAVLNLVSRSVTDEGRSDASYFNDDICAQDALGSAFPGCHHGLCPEDLLGIPYDSPASNKLNPTPRLKWRFRKPLGRPSLGTLTGRVKINSSSKGTSRLKALLHRIHTGDHNSTIVDH